MSKKCISSLLLTLVALVTVNGQNIKANQQAYYTGGNKFAVVPAAQAGSFSLVDATTSTTVYTGTLGAAKTWNPSGESIKIADFTSYRIPGEYYVQTASETSYTFTIDDLYIHHDLSKWSVKAFYLWRASTAITEQCATIGGQSYARASGHADTKVLIHSSAATTARPAGTKVSAPRGWYDAGDYNLYVVNAGMSVHSLLLAYESLPGYFDTLNLNIPESTNAIPDILDEVKWELDWLLAMQDPGDGGVYFKLTSLYFCGYVMPADDNLTRYMVGKSTTSALDFAAMCAMAYRVYKEYDSYYPGFADQCLEAARSAYAWAVANPSVSFTNPSDVYTGGYGDNSYSDEFFWAAAELYISTREKTFYDALDFNVGFYAPSWGSVAGMGLMSLKLHVNELSSDANTTTINSKFLSLASSIYNIYSSSSYKVPISSFYWGSNGLVASHGTVLSLAYLTLQDKNYLDAAVAATDYILGRNATGYSFVTWFGDNTPLNIHHRPSASDGIAKPLPGYVVGGPCTDATSDCGADIYPSTAYNALCYADADCSYSTNEVAINWNAPLANLFASVECAFIPAVVDSAIIPASSWMALELYFDKSLNDSTVADNSVFTVTSNGIPLAVASVAVDASNAKKVTITVDSSFTAGATVQVSYNGRILTTRLSNTPVQAFAGVNAKNYLDSVNLVQYVTLKTGWNLISLYLNPGDSLVDSLFAPVISDILYIKTFDSFYDPALQPSFNTLTTIEGGQGYFVKVGTDVQFTVAGTRIDTLTYELATGWNLIGFPKFIPQAITHSYSSIWTPFLSLKNFDGFHAKNWGVNSISTVEPGLGYFINVGSDASFVYP